MSQDRIILVRHGRPALSRDVKLTWRGYRDWWRQYDEGGLTEEQTIPEEVKRLAGEADIFISSPLRRAVETATLLRAQGPDLIDDDLVEAALPPPHLGPLKFSPRAWGVWARVVWFVGFSDGLESHSAARVRAMRMAKKLAEQASGGKTVLVTAHGWYNRMLKVRLKRLGWDCISENGDLHWNHRILVKDTKE